MNGELGIRDPELNIFIEQAADAIERAMSEVHLPLPSVSAQTVAALLGWIVPRPVLNEARQTAENQARRRLEEWRP